MGISKISIIPLLVSFLKSVKVYKLLYIIAYNAMVMLKFIQLGVDNNV